MTKHKKRNNTKTRLGHFYREYKADLKVVALLLLGYFLLVEEYEIRASLLAFLRGILITFKDLYNYTIEFLIKEIDEIRLSDLIGYIIILVALSMLYFRLRWRFIRNFSELYQCPKCNGELTRIHRTKSQKLLKFVLWARIKNYSCNNCSFQGFEIRARSTHRQ